MAVGGCVGMVLQSRVDEGDGVMHASNGAEGGGVASATPITIKVASISCTSIAHCTYTYTLLKLTTANAKKTVGRVFCYAMVGNPNNSRTSSAASAPVSTLVPGRCAPVPT